MILSRKTKQRDVSSKKLNKAQDLQQAEKLWKAMQGMVALLNEIKNATPALVKVFHRVQEISCTAVISYNLTPK